MTTITSPTPGTHWSSLVNAGTGVSITNGKYPLSTTTRWQWNLTGAESTGNAGSNLQLQSINDDGKTIGTTVYTITRSTGALVFSTPITAYAATVSAAGTNRATSTALTHQFNNIGTVGSGTGVTLPASVQGLTIVITNFGANTVAIYGAGSDTIDTIAGATGTTLTVAHRGATFYSTTTGTWVSALFGAVSS